MTIMILNRHGILSALAALGFVSTLAAITLTTTPASAAGAQYCIARSGVNGDSSYVGNCIYSDYQQCLQAAAESRGNCVQNIEYRPGTPAEPVARRARHTR
jgi:nicotinamide mononucleotide (NMN) deamidase PncC